jgi:Spy/CpxP family protein refolding chaperone
MNKLTSVALSAALVVAGLGATVTAEAHPNEPVGHGRAHHGTHFSHGWHGHRGLGRHRHDRLHHERSERR